MWKTIESIGHLSADSRYVYRYLNSSRYILKPIPLAIYRSVTIVMSYFNAIRTQQAEIAH